MKLGIIGTQGWISNLAKKKFDESFSEVGGNTGNLVFQYASSNLSSNPKSYFNWNDNPNDINKYCSSLLLPLANILGTHTDYSRRAEFINKIKIPIIVIGLGAQSHVASEKSADNLAKRLTQGTIDFARELSYKTETILVRGEFTKRVCAHLGIKNAQVFGCPSNLISDDIELGERISMYLSQLKTNNIVLNAGFYQPGKNNYHEICKIENSILTKNDSEISIVAQGPNDIASYSYGEGEFVERIKDILGNCKSSPKINSFYDINSWVHYIRSSDFSIGTRIHGAILSLQHNQASILITHDSRTEELANLMEIPRISVKDASKMDVDQMITKAKFDANRYNLYRYNMADTICNILEDLHLKPAIHLKKLQSTII